MNKKIREILENYALGKFDSKSGLRKVVYTTDQALIAIQAEVDRCLGKDEKQPKVFYSLVVEGGNQRAKDFRDKWNEAK